MKIQENPVRFIIAALAVFVVLLTAGASCNKDKDDKNDEGNNEEAKEVVAPIAEKEYLEEALLLPAPLKTSKVTVEKALLENEEHTFFVEGQPLSLEDFSQLLWAAQGEVDKETGRRTAVSAKEVHPLELYAYVHNVNTLVPGLYHYIPEEHKLGKLIEGDMREDLLKTTYNLSTPGKTPVTFIITADYEKMHDQYPQGTTAEKIVNIEVGRVTQNMMLQGDTLLNIGMVAITEFDPKQLQKLFKIPNREKPVYIIPVGKRDLKAEEEAEESAKNTNNDDGNTSEESSAENTQGQES